MDVAPIRALPRAPASPAGEGGGPILAREISLGEASRRFTRFRGTLPAGSVPRPRSLPSLVALGFPGRTAMCRLLSAVQTPGERLRRRPTHRGPRCLLHKTLGGGGQLSTPSCKQGGEPQRELVAHSKTVNPTPRTGRSKPAAPWEMRDSLSVCLSWLQPELQLQRSRVRHRRGQQRPKLGPGGASSCCCCCCRPAGGEEGGRDASIRPSVPAVGAASLEPWGRGQATPDYSTEWWFFFFNDSMMMIITHTQGSDPLFALWLCPKNHGVSSERM